MRSSRKILLLFLLIALIFTMGTVGVSAAPEVSAAAAIVMDGDTGAIYYEKNPDDKRVPASMVKLMTCYIVLEEIEKGNLSFDTPIPISHNAASISRKSGYSNVPLTAGDTHTVDEMLKAILLESACGASTVMAEYISGSDSAFSDRMDQTAAKLGLTTDFVDSNGIGNSLITARSMALFADHLIKKYPVILNYTSMQSFVFKGKTYENRNEFVIAKNYYEGVDGLKTGTTNAAGKNITVSAQKGGRRLIVVVMGASSNQNRYSDARKLLDYGFSCMTMDNTALKDASVALNGEKEAI
ncbi:MAG: D-alanyl-D-alanine carboxypeptidase, partial [Firmicutes bacterium]|nr:D-alanyl-D-alanine carboxypeptidase [Bacillota bacterium]